MYIYFYMYMYVCIPAHTYISILFLFWRGIIMFFCVPCSSRWFVQLAPSLSHSHSRRRCLRCLLLPLLPYQVRFKPEPLLTTCLFNFLRFLLHILFVCLTRCACVGAKKQSTFVRGQLNKFREVSVHKHRSLALR